jgi:hypothetical protein
MGVVGVLAATACVGGGGWPPKPKALPIAPISPGRAPPALSLSITVWFVSWTGAASPRPSAVPKTTSAATPAAIATSSRRVSRRAILRPVA